MISPTWCHLENCLWHQVEHVYSEKKNVLGVFKAFSQCINGRCSIEELSAINAQVTFWESRAAPLPQCILNGGGSFETKYMCNKNRNLLLFITPRNSNRLLWHQSKNTVEISGVAGRASDSRTWDQGLIPAPSSLTVCGSRTLLQGVNSNLPARGLNIALITAVQSQNKAKITAYLFSISSRTKSCLWMYSSRNTCVARVKIWKHSFELNSVLLFVLQISNKNVEYIFCEPK